MNKSNLVKAIKRVMPVIMTLCIAVSACHISAYAANKRGRISIKVYTDYDMVSVNAGGTVKVYAGLVRGKTSIKNPSGLKFDISDTSVARIDRQGKYGSNRRYAVISGVRAGSAVLNVSRKGCRTRKIKISVETADRLPIYTEAEFLHGPMLPRDFWNIYPDGRFTIFHLSQNNFTYYSDISSGQIYDVHRLDNYRYSFKIKNDGGEKKTTTDQREMVRYYNEYSSRSIEKVNFASVTINAHQYEDGTECVFYKPGYSVSRLPEDIILRAEEEMKENSVRNTTKVGLWRAVWGRDSYDLDSKKYLLKKTGEYMIDVPSARESYIIA